MPKLTPLLYLKDPLKEFIPLLSGVGPLERVLLADEDVLLSDDRFGVRWLLLMLLLMKELVGVGRGRSSGGRLSEPPCDMDTLKLFS